MASVTLFCLIRGEPIRRAFSVTINHSATVDELMGLIKARRNDLADREMTLWQVNIPADRISALNESVQRTELPPFADIQTFFPNPTRGCLHIIAQLEVTVPPRNSENLAPRPRIKFPPQGNRRQAVSNVTGVLIGRMGTGKTTLLNLLCGVNHPAGAGASHTDRLQLNSVSFGDNPFTLIDTPGSSPTDENYKHSLLQYHALTATPINAILVMIKYDSRHSYVRAFLDDLLGLVSEYVRKVVIVISHWDQVTDQDREFEQLWEAVRTASCANMIVYSNRNRPEEVANMIYDCISQLPSQRLEIDKSTFLVRFDIFTKVGELAEAYRSFEREATTLHREYTDLLTEIMRSTDQQIRSCLDEAIHTLIVQHRQDLEMIEETFHRRYGANMVELNHYAFYLQMQKLSLTLSTNFAAWASQFMSYSLNDAQDPRNLIKACPNCHEIWFKTEGCDGSTTCGARGFSANVDVLSRAWYRFRVSMVNGRRRLNGPVTIPKRAVAARANSTTKGRGCGAAFVWKNLPKIPDEKILELFQVDSIEKAKEFCKRSDFTNVRNRFESNIDQRFYS